MDFIPISIAGLPLHPLVVHFAVVLLPLAAFSTIVAIYIPRYRKGFAFASVFGLLVIKPIPRNAYGYTVLSRLAPL